MSSPQDEVQEYQEISASQAILPASQVILSASRSQHSPELSQASQPVNKTHESDADALSMLARLEADAPEDEEGDVSQTQAELENKKILENFKPPENSSPRKYWQGKKGSTVVKTEPKEKSATEPRHRSRAHTTEPKAEKGESPSPDGKRRSTRLSTTRTKVLLRH
jgi:hypothetical protein